MYNIKKTGFFSLDLLISKPNNFSAFQNGDMKNNTTSPVFDGQGK